MQCGVAEQARSGEIRKQRACWHCTHRRASTAVMQLKFSERQNLKAQQVNGTLDFPKLFEAQPSHYQHAMRPRYVQSMYLHPAHALALHF